MGNIILFLLVAVEASLMVWSLISYDIATAKYTWTDESRMETFEKADGSHRRSCCFRIVRSAFNTSGSSVVKMLAQS